MAKTNKLRVHNEYFKPIVAGRRKSCKNCKAKFDAINNQQWRWFEYRNVRQYTVTWFCKECFESHVKQTLLSHAGSCGCSFHLVGYRCTLPEWLTIDN